MKLFGLRTVIVGLSCLTICGCAVGNSHYPKATEGFQPKGIVEETCRKTFPNIEEILTNNRIPIAQSNDAKYKIETGYINGQTEIIFPIVQVTRFKYNISLSEQKDKRCKINIFANLESSSENIQWHDISSDNPEKVKQLEAWLYEKIEK